VGRTIDGLDAKEALNPAYIERIAKFGKGRFTILEYRLSNIEAGKQARFEWLKFRVDLEIRKESN